MFQVRLFGYFRMTKDEQIINEASMRSPQLLKLLVYLILYRDRAVTNTELEGYLWDDTNGARQKDALKNLICRLRRVLEETFGKDTYISTGRGNYQWNKDIEMDVDVENFEKLYNEFFEEIENYPEEAKRKRENAIEIYQGTFLKSYEAEYWGNLGLKYQSMYLRLTANKLEELQQNESYPEIEKLCTRVLNTDPYDIGWNMTLIKTLLLQNKDTHAEKYYRGLEKTMQNMKGVQKNNLLRTLKNELKRTGLNKETLTYDALLEEIKSQEKSKGAFRCEYREFKALCQLQTRKNARHKENSYSILASVKIDSSTIGAAIEVQDYLTNMAMDDLDEVLYRNLRDCDVLCRCSDSQYIALLDRCSYENTLGVAKRISELFLKKNSSKVTKISIDVHKID